jgi:hypothetical protein
MALIDVARSVDRKNPTWLQENVVSKVFKYLTAVKDALKDENYDVAYVGKTASESGYTPQGFQPQTINGHRIVKVSHDALWVNGKQYDFAASGNDSEQPIFDSNGAPVRATAVANAIPQEYWRKENPPVYDLTVGEPEKPQAPMPKLKDRETFYKELKEVNAFYAAPEGLRRSGGMVINDQADVEALGAWGYNLMLGKTVEECKAEIRNSFEWKAKH